jgi:hypothetical protein
LRLPAHFSIARSVIALSRIALESELSSTISDPDVKKRIDNYRKMAIPAEAIASAMAYAIGQPANVDVNERTEHSVGMPGTPLWPARYPMLPAIVSPARFVLNYWS